MKITYLGQAGLLIETCGKKILIDPYLSRCVEKIHPERYRRHPINEYYLNISPDIIICTHDHNDHFDEETLVHYLGKSGNSILVLTTRSAFPKACKFGNGHRYTVFHRGTVIREAGITLRAVKAEHPDPDAIGFILEAEGKRLYITGDTLYNEEIFRDLPQDIDAIFLPVNGEGNNMNLKDGAAFAKRSGARVAVPYHVGMVDDLTANDFDFEPKVLPQIYCEVNLPI